VNHLDRPSRRGTPPRADAGELPELTRALTETVGSSGDRVDQECKRLLALLRERCPGLLPAQPLPAGQVGPGIPLPPDAAPTLFRLVARQILTLPVQSGAAGAVVVWTQGDDELAVLVDEIGVQTADGAAAVAIPVRCDEVGQTIVRVRFAIGSGERPAGLLATSDDRPFGPPEVVDIWGEALTAFAWQILLTVATRLASATGRDVDGAGLVPAALHANESGFAVTTMARHAFDRRLQG